MANIRDISVELIFNKGSENSFKLLVEGEYYAGTSDTYMEQGDSPEFEMQKVELIDGDLMDLLLMNLTIDTIVEKVFDQLG